MVKGHISSLMNQLIEQYGNKCTEFYRTCRRLQTLQLNRFSRIFIWDIQELLRTMVSALLSHEPLCTVFCQVLRHLSRKTRSSAYDVVRSQRVTLGTYNIVRSASKTLTALGSLSYLTKYL